MATPTTPTRLPGDPLPPPPEPRYPWRVGVTMLGLVVLVLVVVWLAFQAVKGPPTAGEFPSSATATTIARNFEATVSAADTALPRPTPRPTPQPATQAPTSAPVAVAARAVVPAATPQGSTAAAAAATGSSATTASTPAPAANADAQVSPSTLTSATVAAPARTATAVPAGADEATSSTPAPTVTPALVQEVSDAYNAYWQVKADAFYTVDPSRLSDVAIGAEFARLQQQIADDQANGRATRVRVQHNFVVLSADNDQAQIADDYHDLSVWIDPTTHDLLPGQIEPTSADTAPEHKVVVYLQLSDHTWKVADGVELVVQEPPQ